MNIPILYEDNHLLIVEKPVNIPVQEDRTKDKDLLTILKADIKRRYNKPGNVYLSLVHRLDRPVGGAIIFAKTSKAASRLADLMRKREIERSYLAVVRGSVKKDEAQLVHYLAKDRKKNKVYVVDERSNDAKKAILTYKVLERKRQFSLLHITLQTGRSHQIRVQMNEIGHPLFGDQKYGANVNKVGEQIALWAYELSFIHPTTKKRIDIHAPPKQIVPWNEWRQIIK